MLIICILEYVMYSKAEVLICKHSVMCITPCKRQKLCEKKTLCTRKKYVRFSWVFFSLSTQNEMRPTPNRLTRKTYTFAIDCAVLVSMCQTYFVHLLLKTERSWQQNKKRISVFYNTEKWGKIPCWNLLCMYSNRTSSTTSVFYCSIWRARAKRYLKHLVVFVRLFLNRA